MPYQSLSGELRRRVFNGVYLVECRLALRAKASLRLSTAPPPPPPPTPPPLLLPPPPSPQLYLLWAARPRWWDDQYFWDDEGELMQSLSLPRRSSLGSASAGREIKAERTSEMLLEGGDWWSPLCCVSFKHTHSITLSYVLAMSWLKSLTWCILSRLELVLSRIFCCSVCGSKQTRPQLHVQLKSLVSLGKGAFLKPSSRQTPFLCLGDQYVEVYTQWIINVINLV